jgi:hypothetical protein
MAIPSITEEKEPEQFNRFLKACVSLAGNPDFEAMKTYLHTRLFSISLTNNKNADDVKTRWNQGRGQELMDILGWMRPEFAAETLKKRTSPPVEPGKIL